VEIEEEASDVDTTGVVAEVDIELTTLCVVSVDVCMDTVGFPVEGLANDEVENSIEEVTIRRVELGVCCDISVAEGISSEVIVEGGGMDSAEGVDAALSISVGGVVGASAAVELSICRISSFTGRIPLTREPGPTDTTLPMATKRIVDRANSLISK